MKYDDIEDTELLNVQPGELTEHELTALERKAGDAGYQAVADYMGDGEVTVETLCQAYANFWNNYVFYANLQANLYFTLKAIKNQTASKLCSDLLINEAMKENGYKLLDREYVKC